MIRAAIFTLFLCGVLAAIVGVLVLSDLQPQQGETFASVGEGIFSTQGWITYPMKNETWGSPFPLESGCETQVSFAQPQSWERIQNLQGRHFDGDYHFVENRRNPRAGLEEILGCSQGVVKVILFWDHGDFVLFIPAE